MSVDTYEWVGQYPERFKKERFWLNNLAGRHPKTLKNATNQPANDRTFASNIPIIASIMCLLRKSEMQALATGNLQEGDNWRMKTALAVTTNKTSFSRTKQGYPSKVKKSLWQTNPEFHPSEGRSNGYCEDFGIGQKNILKDAIKIRASDFAGQLQANCVRPLGGGECDLNVLSMLIQTTGKKEFDSKTLPVIFFVVIQKNIVLVYLITRILSRVVQELVIKAIFEKLYQSNNCEKVNFDSNCASNSATSNITTCASMQHQGGSVNLNNMAQQQQEGQMRGYIEEGEGQDIREQDFQEVPIFHNFDGEMEIDTDDDDDDDRFGQRDHGFAFDQRVPVQGENAVDFHQLADEGANNAICDPEYMDLLLADVRNEPLIPGVEAEAQLVDLVDMAHWEELELGQMFVPPEELAANAA